MCTPRPYRTLLAITVMFVAAPPGAAGESDPGEPPPPSGAVTTGPVADVDIHVPRWVFAVEDTADLTAFFKMSTISIRTERLRIGEIVDRCIRNEQEARDRIESLEVTVLSKSIFYVGGRDSTADRRLVTEQVDRTFFRRPNETKTVPLRSERYQIENGERKPWEADEGDDAVSISYREFDELPFYLEDRDEYDFEILSREIVVDRVIYEVKLTPKSDFEIAPQGRIWIDSSNFQILREEFEFGDRVPMPMIIKSIGPFVRERERVGDEWVWKRFLIRVDLRVGYLRFLNKDIPDRVDLVVWFDGHRVNEGWSTDAVEIADGAETVPADPDGPDPTPEIAP